MRFLWLLLVAGVAAQLDDYEEEELEDPYNEEDYEHSRKTRDHEAYRTRRDVHDDQAYRTRSDVHDDQAYRTRRDVHDDQAYRTRRDVHDDQAYGTRRDVHDEGPYEEHIRVKRCTYEDVPVSRARRSADYVRVPRQVHQYEVHEFTDDGYPSSPPYEEMLAASAEHYHKVYAAPGAPSSKYLSPDVSGIPVVYRPVPSVPSQNTFSSVPSQYREPVQFVPVKASIQVADVPQSFKSPIGIVKAPALGPVPVPAAPVPIGTAPVASVNAVPLASLADDQQGAAALVKHNQHSTRHKQGGGHAKHSHHDAHRGGKSSKGFNHEHHVDKGAKGYKEDELHRKEYEEAEGKKKKHHDHADHKGSHEEQAHGHRGSKFDEKKGHKKGHKTKGYHNKYHKDEFHKEHKFYDDYHKSGEHHRYGKFNAKHASNESGKKKAHHVNAGHDFVERGKKGYSNKGHLDADNKGYNGKQGHEEHHEHHSSHGKKGGKEGGSQWKHAKGI